MRASRVRRVAASGRGMRWGACLVLLAAAGFPVACDPAARGLGDPCLKDGDCRSGLCSARSCAAPPPASPTPAGAGAGLDAEAEADADAETLADGAAFDASPADAHDDGGAAEVPPAGSSDAAPMDGGSVPQDGAAQDAPQEG